MDDRPTRSLGAHCVPYDAPLPCQVTLIGTNVLVNPFENLEEEMAEHHRLKTDPEAAKAEEKVRSCGKDM